MQLKLLTALLTVACTSVQAQTNTVETTSQTEPLAEVVKVKVTGDRVSLRAKPDTNGELLDRAMRGEELVHLGETNGWVAVQAPDSLDFWVSGEYIVNGVVIPQILNVRSGPSRNYSIVYEAKKDDTVSVRGEFNGWFKIAPPKGSRVWISADYTEIIKPPEPEPVVEPAEETSEPEPVVEPVEETPEPESKAPELTDPEKKPLLLVLDKSKIQGVYDEIPGVLRRSHPGLYKLVLIAGDIEEPICLVRGNESQMERYLNRSMLIKGKKYWAKDVELPVIKVEKIHLDPILND